MGRLTRGIKPCVRFERNSLSSPVLAPLEVRYQRDLLVNNEKFLTGQAAGLSNGVNSSFKLGVRSYEVKTKSSGLIFHDGYDALEP